MVSFLFGLCAIRIVDENTYGMINDTKATQETNAGTKVKLIN